MAIPVRSVTEVANSNFVVVELIPTAVADFLILVNF